MKTIATALLALLFVTSMASAQCYDLLLDNGTMGFDYQQPGGGIAGNFVSLGGLVGNPPTEGTAAATFVLDGINYLVVIGAVEDGANFRDGGVLVLSSLVPITVGNYSLDGIDGLFVFIDDAVGWNPPADICATNWAIELASIVAAGKYGSVSGNVNVASLDPTGASGTFNAAVTDPDTGITLDVTSGSFNVLPPSAVDGSTWGSIKTLYR